MGSLLKLQLQPSPPLHSFNIFRHNVIERCYFLKLLLILCIQKETTRDICMIENEPVVCHVAAW